MCLMKDIDPRLEMINDTGPIGYSESAGKPRKCLFKGLTVSDDFQYKKVLFGTKKLSQ